MRNLLLRDTSLRLLLFAGFVGLPLTSALGHEAHHAECSDTAIKSLKADIQAMTETWGRLHAVRTGLGIAAALAYLWALN